MGRRANPFRGVSRVFRRAGHGLKRIGRGGEKLVRKTLDIFDPLVDLDGSRQKQMLREYANSQREAMDRAEAREREIQQQALNKAKYEDKVANDRRAIEEAGSLNSIKDEILGSRSGSTSLSNAIRLSKKIKENGNTRQKNEAIDDEEEEILRKLAMRKKK